MKKTIIFLTFLASFIFSGTVHAEYHYIRDGASGSPPCTGGWGDADACEELPDTLVRGDTYFIADGT